MISNDKIRRYDLDWLRVLVFGLLIFYHVGMFFVPWWFHVKNSELSEDFVLPMLFVNQWRLPLLFLISGMGTRFALAHRSAKAFLKERNIRLLIPLVFGMMVIVPPQVYLERIYQGLEYTSFLQFYPDYFNGIYPDGNFSWHHLWFLPYLLTYSIVLTPLFIYLRRQPPVQFIVLLKQLLKKPAALYLLIIPIVLIEIFLKPHFPLTRNLISDWYGFFHYLLFFLLGYIFITVQDEFWKSIQKLGPIALFGGILSFILFIAADRNGISHELTSTLAILNVWNWIIAILYLGARFLNKPSNLLSYCNKAVYPFYILHQTIMMILGFEIKDWELGLLSKFLLISGLTFLITWVVYEFIVRRIAILRSLFGMKSEPKQ